MMDKKLAPEQRDEIMNHFDAIDVLEIQEFRMALLDFLNANTEPEHPCSECGGRGWNQSRNQAIYCKCNPEGKTEAQLRED